MEFDSKHIWIISKCKHVQCLFYNQINYLMSDSTEWYSRIWTKHCLLLFLYHTCEPSRVYGIISEDFLV